MAASRAGRPGSKLYWWKLEKIDLFAMPMTICIFVPRLNISSILTETPGTFSESADVVFVAFAWQLDTVVRSHVPALSVEEVW